jgi:hypothetical protein
MRFLGILLITIITSSCSFHYGSLGGGSAAITDADFSRVELAYGTSKSTNIFGIGGNDKEGLVLEAKRNLYLNRPLSATEAIGQTTLDFKKTYFFPVMVTKVVLSAEIIDFEQKNSSSTGAYILEDFVEKSTSERFKNKKISYVTKGGQLTPVKIIGQQGDKLAIAFYDQSQNFVVRWVKPEDLKIED